MVAAWLPCSTVRVAPCSPSAMARESSSDGGSSAAKIELRKPSMRSTGSRAWQR